MRTLVRFSSWLPLIKVATALLLGLAFIVPGQGQPTPDPPRTGASLQSCAGRYQASDDTIVTVRTNGNGLTLEVNSGSPMEFSPESEDHFVHEQSGTKMAFVRDDRGNVTDLVL